MLSPNTQSFYTDKLEGIDVHMIPCRKDNYSFVLQIENSQFCVLIDSSEKNKVLDFLGQNALVPQAVFLTHHHYDHIDGLKELQKKYHIPLYIEKTDAQRPEFKDLDVSIIDQKNYSIEGLDLQVLKTPGHTQNHLSYYIEKSKSLFCGDTLFSLGCGRVFEPSPDVFEKYFLSLKKISQLPPETKVYCAHEYTASNYSFGQHHGLLSKSCHLDLTTQILGLGPKERSIPSTLSFELLHNPFLKAKNPNELKDLRLLKDCF